MNIPDEMLIAAGKLHMRDSAPKLYLTRRSDTWLRVIYAICFGIGTGIAFMKWGPA